MYGTKYYTGDPRSVLNASGFNTNTDANSNSESDHSYDTFYDTLIEYIEDDSILLEPIIDSDINRKRGGGMVDVISILKSKIVKSSKVHPIAMLNVPVETERVTTLTDIPIHVVTNILKEAFVNDITAVVTAVDTHNTTKMAQIAKLFQFLNINKTISYEIKSQLDLEVKRWKNAQNESGKELDMNDELIEYIRLCKIKRPDKDVRLKMNRLCGRLLSSADNPIALQSILTLYAYNPVMFDDEAVSKIKGLLSTPKSQPKPPVWLEPYASYIVLTKLIDIISSLAVYFLTSYSKDTAITVFLTHGDEIHTCNFHTLNDKRKWYVEFNIDDWPYQLLGLNSWYGHIQYDSQSILSLVMMVVTALLDLSQCTLDNIHNVEISVVGLGEVYDKMLSIGKMNGQESLQLLVGNDHIWINFWGMTLKPLWKKIAAKQMQQNVIMNVLEKEKQLHGLWKGGGRKIIKKTNSKHI